MRPDVASTWMTFEEAAELTGCPRSTLHNFAQEGRIRHRGKRVWRGALERRSVERFAPWYAEVAQQRELMRRERAARAAEREARRQAAMPPQDGDVWLDATTAAMVLGCTPQWVIRLAGDERLPAVRRGRQWWLRRRDVEQRAAAAVLAQRYALH